jgi:hypothetical protein
MLLARAASAHAASFPQTTHVWIVALHLASCNTSSDYILLQSLPTPRLGICDRTTSNLHMFHHACDLIFDTACEPGTEPENRTHPSRLPPSLKRFSGQNIWLRKLIHFIIFQVAVFPSFFRAYFLHPLFCTAVPHRPLAKTTRPAAITTIATTRFCRHAHLRMRATPLSQQSSAECCCIIFKTTNTWIVCTLNSQPQRIKHSLCPPEQIAISFSPKHESSHLSIHLRLTSSCFPRPTAKSTTTASTSCCWKPRVRLTQLSRAFAQHNNAAESITESTNDQLR